MANSPGSINSYKFEFTDAAINIGGKVNIKTSSNAEGMKIQEMIINIRVTELQISF